MAVGNALNIQQPGVVSFDGTSVFTGSVLTQYDVLVGGTSNAIVNVAPSATSGVPLISNGSSSNPSFGTASVSGGGTGATTLTGVLIGNGTSAVTGNTVTQHDVLIGGASNAITSVSPSTAGLVLTSNGVSADPSFQAIPSNSFSPNSTVNIFDDFMTFTTGSSGLITSLLPWISGGQLTASVSVTSNGHPGNVENASLTTTGGIFLAGVSSTTLIQTFLLGGGVITINWVFNIVTASNSTNRYTLRCGMGDTTAAATDQANGVYFEYSDNINSGDWNCKTASASTRTTSSSSTSVTTGWHNAQITINAAGTSIAFTMDGVLLETIITNIPSTGITPFFQWTNGAGTVAAGSIIIDLFYLTQTLTTAR